jgi:hypothetical protein
MDDQETYISTALETVCVLCQRIDDGETIAPEEDFAAQLAWLGLCGIAQFYSIMPRNMVAFRDAIAHPGMQQSPVGYFLLYGPTDK